jgi:hypothetical protein
MTLKSVCMECCTGNTFGIYMYSIELCLNMRSAQNHVLGTKEGRMTQNILADHHLPSSYVTSVI